MLDSIHSILIVDDDPMNAKLMEKLIQKMGMRSEWVEGGRAALTRLKDKTKDPIHVILLDLMMPDMDGMATMRGILRDNPHIPIIFLTSHNDVETATQAIRAGAYDYMTKPFDAQKLMVTIKNALKLHLMAQRAAPAKWTAPDEGLRFTDLIGAERGLRYVIDVASRVAGTDLPILIMGETGTGKEVLARAIHGESNRSAGPFVAVNCGAIPEHLIESTLFGHEKGAFTGATEKSAGKFRAAEGGTLFLDEIGEMPLSAQTRLLRVLQEQKIDPVGAARPISINVRIIAATNRDLPARVAGGTFREDLYFRLNVMPLILPPLRERAEDLPDLAQHLMTLFTTREGLPPRTLAPAALASLKHHTWPGNVRELENILRRAIVLSDHEPLTPQDITPLLNTSPASTALPIITPATPEDKDISARLTPALDPQGTLSLKGPNGTFKSLDQIEQEVMENAIKQAGGNMALAARMLGIGKATLYRKRRER
jgi:DNA-binding NtrC family response regulator